MRLGKVILAFAVFSVKFIQAQHAWEAKFLPGFLIPHHEDMSAMMAHIYGLEIGREWKVDSGGFIEKKQYKPYVGVAINYYNLGNSTNGHSIGLFGYYDAGIKLGKYSSLRGRFGVGTGYLSKEYDINKDPQNRAIGSHINGFMQILSYVQTPIGPRMDLNLGLGLSHYSNGNWSQPNLGINLPSLVLGIKARESGTRYLNVLQHYHVPEVIQWQFSARMGRRQIGIDDPKNITNYVLEADIIYPHNLFRQWRFGVLSFFDRTYVYTKFQPMPNHIRPDQITELAIQGGHEYRMGKLGFVTDLGLYVYRPDRSKRMYYEGVGLKYYVTENFIIMNRLKAHLTSADYFEWGIAYNLVSNAWVKPGFWNGWRWIFHGFRTIRIPSRTPEF